MKKLVVLLLLLTAILGGARFVLGRWPWESARPPARGIEISGTVETVETDASFQIPGKIRRLRIDEGDNVKLGQLIAELDETDLQKQKLAAEHAWKAAQSQIPQLQSRIELSQAQNAARVSQAQGVVAESRARLADLRSGSRPQEVAQARDEVHVAAREVDAARDNLQFAEKEAGRAERLYRADAMPGEQRDRAANTRDVAEARYRQATQRLSQARERLSLVREGPRVGDIEAAQERVSQAESALQLARSGGLETQTLALQRRTLTEQMRQAAATLAYTEAQLQHTRLRSPVSGRVLVKAKEQGEVVSPGTTVVTLGDLEHVYLRAYIGETDLGKVKLDQMVDVTTDSYPDHVYRGRIYYISSQAEFTPKNLQTKDDRVKLVYRIKVALDNPDQELKAGMIADGVILPATSPGPPTRSAAPLEGARPVASPAARALSPASGTGR